MSAAAIFNVGDRVTDNDPRGFPGVGIVMGVFVRSTVLGGHLYDVAYYRDDANPTILNLPVPSVCRVVDDRLSNVEDEPETALSWYRMCSGCGVTLTVSQFNENTQEPHLTIAPKNEPCGACGYYAPGRWRPGSLEWKDGEPEPVFTTDAKIDRYEEEQEL